MWSSENRVVKYCECSLYLKSTEMRFQRVTSFLVWLIMSYQVVGLCVPRNTKISIYIGLIEVTFGSIINCVQFIWVKKEVIKNKTRMTYLDFYSFRCIRYNVFLNFILDIILYPNSALKPISIFYINRPNRLIFMYNFNN